MNSAKEDIASSAPGIVGAGIAGISRIAAAIMLVLAQAVQDAEQTISKGLAEAIEKICEDAAKSIEKICESSVSNRNRD